MVQQSKTTTNKHSNILFWIMTIALFFAIAFHTSPLWDLAALFWFKGLLAALAIVAFVNASILIGYKHASLFLAFGAVIGWTFEQLGVQTGAVFGPYVYTEKLGLKIGDIPWVIPICWFALVYFAHVIVNLIVNAHPVSKVKSTQEAFTLAFLTGLVATGMDMALDPALSHPDVAAWIWTDGGQYFGVPFKNFGGWVLTAFLIDFCYRMYAKGRSSVSHNRYVNLSAFYAVLAWAGLGVGFMVIGYPLETQLVAVFTVVLPAFLAFTRMTIRETHTQ